MKKKFKNNKGAVSVLVAITVFTYVAVLFGTFITISIFRESQLKSDKRIQDVYGKDINEIDNIYQGIIQNDVDLLNEEKIVNENDMGIVNEIQR